jgi:Uri superfamily endonuclease
MVMVKIEAMPDLPNEPGSYALFLKLSTSQELSVGRLGIGYFPTGSYVYLGSARGSGGLRARLKRHLRGASKHHWHIDSLRAVTQVQGYCYLKDQSSPVNDLSVECLWSLKLTESPGIHPPLVGFGASDCRMGCAAHLFYLSEAETVSLERYRKIFADAANVSPDMLTCQVLI